MAGIAEINAAVELAEAEAGVRRPGSKLRVCAKPGKHQHRQWSKTEDGVITANYGKMSEHKIAELLGRTWAAVHIRIVRAMHLTAPSKSPLILTAEHVAMGLGMDGKSVHRLMDSGLMPCRRLPERERDKSSTRIVDRLAFLRWLIEPAHWIYFKTDRVGALRPRGKRGFTGVYDFAFWEDARDLVAKARADWKDEWLTPGQAAAAIGYKNPRTGMHSVSAAIRAGNLPAVRWGNWCIRRSSLPATGMSINVYGKIVPKAKPKYLCPRGMARHVNLSTCMKLRFCREAINGAAR